MSSVIDVSGLTKDYGAVRAVDEVSFAVRAGTITGFLGPNGSGKSTTLRILAGLVEATAGTARLGGVPYRAEYLPYGSLTPLLRLEGAGIGAAPAAGALALVALLLMAIAAVLFDRRDITP